MDSTKKMISIWTWSGLILTLYGLLILGSGLYRWATDAPATTKLAHLHPDIWWPIIILVLAGGLLLTGRKENRQ
jgi:hypothetical protein